MLFSEQQLNNKDFFQDTNAKANKYMFYDQVNEAYRLAKDLEASLEKIKDFKEKHFDLYGQYKKMIYRLKWIGLQIMTESMAVEMFQYHFTQIFYIPYFNFAQLWDKLKVILLANLIFKERDVFKKELRQALLNNQEKLTSKKLIINNQEKMPTVGNWVLDYNSVLGSGVADNLQRTQYFTNSSNIKKLDQDEKNKVKLLLDLYERLKLSSLTLEGLEEDIPVDEPGREGIIKGGVFEPYKEEKIISQSKTIQLAVTVEQNKNSNLDQLKQLAAEYPAGSFERKAVEEEISRITRNS